MVSLKLGSNYHTKHLELMGHANSFKANTGSGNGLAPHRRQAITWTNADLLSIVPLTYFTEILMEIQLFSLKKMHVKILSAKWQPFCFGFNVLHYAVGPSWVNFNILTCNLKHNYFLAEKQGLKELVLLSQWQL